MTVAEFEKDFFVKFRPTSLLKRFVSAEEVANLAVYLCSPLASATTGAAMRVDGGVVNQIMYHDPSRNDCAIPFKRCVAHGKDAKLNDASCSAPRFP